MKSIWLTTRVLGFMCIALSAHAGEQRVLLSFDNAGHQVRQIVRLSDAALESTTSNPSELVGTVPELSTLNNELQPGTALLLWLDDQGRILLDSREPDPRVSHAPGHIRGDNAARYGHSDGAWLISGPQLAVSVLIVLPEVTSIGLMAEQWNVSLVEQD